MNFDTQHVTEDAIRRIVREELERVLKATEPEQMVDLGTMARILNVSPDTVYRLARAGDIPGHKLGTWRFWPSEVRAYLNRPRDPWAQSARSRTRRRIT